MIIKRTIGFLALTLTIAGLMGCLSGGGSDGGTSTTTTPDTSSGTTPSSSGDTTSQNLSVISMSVNYAETQDEMSTWGGLVDNFVISYGTTSGSYTKSVTVGYTEWTPEVPVTAPYELTTFTYPLSDTFDSGVTYYFVVKACIQQNCGANTNELAFTAP